MWKNRNNGNKQAYKQKQKSQSAGIHHMVCMENGRTIKHGLLFENHIKCKTGILCNETQQNKRSKETRLCSPKKAVIQMAYLWKKDCNIYSHE